MDFLKLANRAVSTLASGIDNDDLSLTLASGGGAKFPSSGDFHITIFHYSAGTESDIEIVKCTARTGDTLTIVREQEGTSAIAHAAGDRVQLRITAGVLENIEDEIDDHIDLGVHSEIRLTPKTSSSGPEGTIFYDSEDKCFYGAIDE